MVVFTCNNCGDTLQKPKVAKHYQFRCRTAPFLTCADCFKDFRGEEYVAHTKCITEAERYGGKDYVPKPGVNKGERKQQQWVNIVNSILDSTTNLSHAERGFLNGLSKYQNIPRKKAKFLNFVYNAMGSRTNLVLIESVWNIMETTYKNNTQSTTEKQQQNDTAEEKVDDKKDVNGHQENNVIENQNNENICRESQSENQQNKSNETHSAKNGTVNNHGKKKKSKKRAISETVEEQTEEAVSKEKDESIVEEEPIPKKKSKNIVAEESLINQCDDTLEKLNFDWKGTILDTVRSKGEISLKKLQKKVISQYMSVCSNSVTDEKATAKFNKKLKKVSEIIISDEKVKLA